MKDQILIKLAMSNELSTEEFTLLQIIKDLKPFETIELKRNEQGEIVYVYTQKKKYIFLTTTR